MNHKEGAASPRVGRSVDLVGLMGTQREGKPAQLGAGWSETMAFWKMEQT